MEYVAGKDKILFVIQEYNLPSRIILVPHREFMLHRRDEYNLIREKCKVKWLEYPDDKNKRLFPAKVMYKKVIWSLSSYSLEELEGIDEDSPIADAYNLLLHYFAFSSNKILTSASFSSLPYIASLESMSDFSSNNYSSISSSTESLSEVKEGKEDNMNKELEKYLDEKDIFWVNKCKFFLATNNEHLLNYVYHKKMENVSEAYLFLEN